jgi:DNA-binding helix-turn-helix protein
MRFLNEAELHQVIGSNIKYYRRKAGLTQVQLSEQVQISISYLSKIEATRCSKSLSISVLNHIANTLDVDIKEFFIKR